MTLIQGDVIDVMKYKFEIEPYPELHIFDYFGQVNVSDMFTVVTATVLSSTCDERSGYLSGEFMTTTNRSVAVFDKLRGICSPGKNLTIQFTAKINGIGRELVAITTLRFRECIDGEIFELNECVACKPGSYSLRYDPDEKVCTPCPLNTDDCFGDKMMVTPGYWRLSPDTIDMLPCPYGDNACIGGDIDGNASSEVTTITTQRMLQQATIFNSGCAVGYEGVLCATCSDGYYLSSAARQCFSCEGQGERQLAILIAIPLIIIIVVIIFIALLRIYGTSWFACLFNIGYIKSFCLGDSEGAYEQAAENFESYFDTNSTLQQLKILFTVFQV